MCLNGILIDLEPNIGQIVRVNDPKNILVATARMKLELQLSYLENKKLEIVQLSKSHSL